MFLFGRLFSRVHRSDQAHRFDRYFRPQVEQLERREVPAAAFVNVVPSGPISDLAPSFDNGAPQGINLNQGGSQSNALIGTQTGSSTAGDGTVGLGNGLFLPGNLTVSGQLANVPNSTLPGIQGLNFYTPIAFLNLGATENQPSTTIGSPGNLVPASSLSTTSTAGDPAFLLVGDDISIYEALPTPPSFSPSLSRTVE